MATTNPTTPPPAWMGPLKTFGRYGLTVVGTTIAVLSSIGWMSPESVATATQSLQDLAEAAGKLTAAITMLAGVAGATYATIRGTLNSTPAAIQAEVANRDDRIVVPIDPSKKEESAKALAKVPEALAVITNKEVAESIPIAKIVAPDSDRAAA